MSNFSNFPVSTETEAKVMASTQLGTLHSSREMSQQRAQQGEVKLLFILCQPVDVLKTIPSI
jgi:hypothetical protein